MKKGILAICICLGIACNMFAQTTLLECSGTAMPYKSVEVDNIAFYPDTLTPFFINHLGRHGARYPTSSKDFDVIINILRNAKKDNGLTACGDDILRELVNIRQKIDNKWGKLTPIGEKEQIELANRLMLRFPNLLAKDSKVNIEAIATSVPRCISSMDAYLGELEKNNANIKVKIGRASCRERG